MSLPERCRSSISVAVMMAAILTAGIALAQPGDVRVGMSADEVRQRLGEPDRTAVLVGKELRDAADVPAADRARLRQVYIYATSGVQVWLHEGKVTGVTRHGVAQP